MSRNLSPVFPGIQDNRVMYGKLWSGVPESRAVIGGVIAQLFPGARRGVPGILFIADPGNSANVFIGGVNVSANAAEFPLGPGRSAFVYVDDADIESIDIGRYHVFAAANQTLWLTVYSQRRI